MAESRLRRYLAFWGKRVVADVDDELAFHLEMRVRDYQRQGLSRAEAEQAARARFGDVERIGHQLRIHDEARQRANQRKEIMSDLTHDARLALRGFRRTPGFAAVAVLTLALGIAATTVVYSVVDGVVLRPLAYRDPARLYVVREVARELAEFAPTLPANAGHFLEWRARCRACAGLGALQGLGLTLTGAGDPERLGAARISSNLFPLLGVVPRLGRSFAEEEDHPGRDRVVIISDALWRRQFNGDPAVLGRSVTLDGEPYSVVGVMAPDFHFPSESQFGALTSLPREIDVFKPIALTPEEIDSPGGFNFIVLARLAPGATERSALAELNAAQSAVMERMTSKLTLSARLESLQDQIVGPVRRALFVLLAAIASVLLIVCVNLANLQLARNASRRHESAIRVALGASRGRLVSQSLVESLLLSVTGGLLGILVARWGLRVLLRTAPADLPRLGEVQLDARVMAFAIALSALAGLLFGVLPALRLSRLDPGDALKSQSRTMTEGRAGTSLRRLLVGAEVGLSTVLLITAGLLIASFVTLLRADKGFQAERVLTLDVALPVAQYQKRVQRVQFFDQSVALLAALPGVSSAAVVNTLPLAGESEANMLSVENDTRPPNERPVANLRYVSPAYFATLGIPVRRGAAFTDADRTRHVIMLSERAAASLFPGQDPLGKRVVAGDNASPAEVVGIVPDVGTTTLEQKTSLIAYVPMWDRAPVIATLLLRANGDPASMTAPARAAIRSIDPGVPIQRVRTMQQVVSVSLAQRRFQTLLLGLFAVTALVVACLGVYGVIAHSLANRSTELSIRMALGATSGNIHRQVLREGLAPVVGGLIGGVTLALLIGRLLGSLLFEVRPWDPATLTSVVVVLLSVAALACYIPARRATAAGPLGALRRE